MCIKIACYICVITASLVCKTGTAQTLLFASDQSVSVNPRQTDTALSYRPLQELTLTGARGNRLNVSDGAGKVYL